MNEYQNLRCRLVDLATGSPAEIDSLAEELGLTDSAEDEIALHGELRYVHRLTPVSTTSHEGIGPPGRRGREAVSVRGRPRRESSTR